MAIVKTTQKSLLDNLMGSLLAVPIGILLFLASFVVLFQSEGCTNLGDVAASAAAVEADTAGGHDESFVSVTGVMATTEKLGDPEFLAPGSYLRLRRDVEQYVWVEHSDSETRDKVGGGTETVTTYTYEMEWTGSPQDSSHFEDRSKRNPPQRVTGESWTASQATVGAWGFDVGSANLPGSERVTVSQDMLRGRAAAGTLQGGYVYLDGSASNPTLGDHRVSFSAIASGETATAFGLARGERLEPYAYEDGESWLGVRYGSREEAIATFNTEHAMMMWLLRIGGFFMMFIGMNMVFSPLQAIAGIIPFIKRGTTKLVSLVTFPIALVLTGLTIVVGKIFHSVLGLIIMGALCAAGGFLLYKRFKQAKEADAGPMGAPAGMPSGAPPMGPPPGAPPMGPPPGAPPAGPPAGPPPSDPPA